MQEFQDQIFSQQKKLQEEKALARHKEKQNKQEIELEEKVDESKLNNKSSKLRNRKSGASSSENEDSIGPQGKEVYVSVDDLKEIKKNGKRVWFTGLEISNLSVAVKYVITDTKKHKRAWLIGFFTVFLVVTFVR